MASVHEMASQGGDHHATLADAAAVFGTQSAIREAARELASAPFQHAAAERLRFLLGAPSEQARAALARLAADEQHDGIGGPGLMVVADEVGA